MSLINIINHESVNMKKIILIAALLSSCLSISSAENTKIALENAAKEQLDLAIKKYIEKSPESLEQAFELFNVVAYQNDSLDAQMLAQEYLRNMYDDAAHGSIDIVLIIMKFVVNKPMNYVARAEAVFRMAEMIYYGQGIEQDINAAKLFFSSLVVVKNNLEFSRAAEIYLAAINIRDGGLHNIRSCVKTLVTGFETNPENSRCRTSAKKCLEEIYKIPTMLILIAEMHLKGYFGKSDLNAAIKYLTLAVQQNKDMLVKNGAQELLTIIYGAKPANLNIQKSSSVVEASPKQDSGDAKIDTAQELNRLKECQKIAQEELNKILNKQPISKLVIEYLG